MMLVTIRIENGRKIRLQQNDAAQFLQKLNQICKAKTRMQAGTPEHIVWSTIIKMFASSGKTKLGEDCIAAAAFLRPDTTKQGLSTLKNLNLIKQENKKVHLL